MAARLILGIDPGSKATGYGLIRGQGQSLACPAAGLIRPPAGWSLARRLEGVYDGLTEVIAQTEPDEMAVEDIFFAKNARSAIALGHVRGVALLAAAKAGLPITIYTPASIKKAVVGYGRASKEQVSTVVRSLLNINKPLALDTTDALACAICHYHTSATLRRIEAAEGG